MKAIFIAILKMPYIAQKCSNVVHFPFQVSLVLFGFGNKVLSDDFLQSSKFLVLQTD